jgi:hypothetical protein
MPTGPRVRFARLRQLAGRACAPAGPRTSVVIAVESTIQLKLVKKTRTRPAQASSKPVPAAS